MAPPKLLALILAGGEGGRLDLLTEGRAKPATPFGGIYRLVDFPLSNCMNARIDDVWVLQQYQPHSLIDHLANGRPWDLDRTYGGMQILHPHLGGREGGWYRGNADAIHRSRPMIEAFGPDLVLVLSADHVYRLDYRDVVATHRDHGARATLVTTTVPRAAASRFGNVEVDGDGRVTRFAYKPDEPLGELVTTEVFVYDAGELLEALAELAREADEEEGIDDFGDALLPRLVEEGGVVEHRLAGYWRDVGTVDAYYAGNMDLLADPPALDLDDPGWPIRTAAPQRVPARILAGARIDGSLVSPGCRVEGTVVRSVLGPGVVVEAGADVRDSVVLDDVRIAAGARVATAIVDSRADVGRRAEVGESVAGEPGPDDVAMVAAGARVPDGGTVERGGRFGRRLTARLVALVDNPRSGGGWSPDDVERRLREHGVEVRRHPIEELRAAVAGVDRVVAAAGDGTLGAVAAAAGAAGVPLAVVPVGTGNDFARRMGIPLPIEPACRLAACGETLRRVDLARADGRPFLNVASAGLAVRAAREARPFKRALGAGAYAVGAVRAAVAGRSVDCRVVCDGREAYVGPAWQVIVANSGAFGGGATVETADPGDRRLDVAVLPAGSRTRLVRYAWALRAGSIAAARGVRHARCRAARVEVAPGTPFNVDGEVLPLGPIAVTLEPAAVAVVVPGQG